jgi:hypothetical protein
MKKLTVPQAIVAGGLVVGVLDILDAFIFFGVRNGTAPLRILQAISSGLLGRSAYQGGWTTGALGLLLHFTIATGIVTVFVLASRKLPVLLDRPWIVGPLYGVAAYLVMNLIVLPFDANPPAAFPSGSGLANGVLIHIFGVGLPAVMAARQVR